MATELSNYEKKTLNAHSISDEMDELCEEFPTKDRHTRARRRKDRARKITHRSTLAKRIFGMTSYKSMSDYEKSNRRRNGIYKTLGQFGDGYVVPTEKGYSKKYHLPSIKEMADDAFCIQALRDYEDECREAAIGYDEDYEYYEEMYLLWGASYNDEIDKNCFVVDYANHESDETVICRILDTLYDTFPADTINKVLAAKNCTI